LIRGSVLQAFHLTPPPLCRLSVQSQCGGDGVEAMDGGAPILNHLPPRDSGLRASADGEDRVGVLRQ
jgi:hypothetical protein